ncbi:MAG: phosphopentomutase [Rhizobiaceae bacterium]
MARAFLFVLDSFGIGGAPDANAYGDAGSNTLGHIAAHCAKGKGDKQSLRQGGLRLPNLDAAGLGAAARLATGDAPIGLKAREPASGLYGAASETSKGKDTPSGHWEIAGVPVVFDWGYFPDTIPTFPEPLIKAIIEESGIAGILGDCHASGTDIIARLGEEHMRTGKPIFYTSSDSVLQIAAHERTFGLDALYRLCEIARKQVDPYNIGRVIARPFLGSNSSDFERTGNRRDYSVLPPEPTLLDRLKAAGRQVIAIGKIGDIYAHQGVTDVRKANGNMALFDTTLAAMDDARNGDLVFTNFVDFDMLFGHRRDVPGYAHALESFDARLPEALRKMREGDIMALTADHGCDPTWRGTDHTRERVPVLVISRDLKPASIGVRPTFADIGESIAAWLGIAPGPHGTSFLPFRAHA